MEDCMPGQDVPTPRLSVETEPTIHNIFSMVETVGKPSKIHAYSCLKAKTHKKCIWLCRRQGRNTIAWDVPIDEEGQYVISLRGENRWWNRYSFYNYVGVRHVQIKFLEQAEEGKPMKVIARVFDYMKGIEQEQKAIESMPTADYPESRCGVDKAGYRHGDDEVCDMSYEEYIHGDMVRGCRTKDLVKQKHRIESLKWMPEMLDHYWLKGIQGEGLSFLAHNGFVLSYEHLSEECYFEAEDPLGKTVNALELISGWRVRRLLWTTLIAMACNVCILAVVTFVSNAIGTGLAAASYAVGIEALLLALLTMLSVVLP